MEEEEKDGEMKGKKREKMGKGTRKIKKKKKVKRE